jgi:hypothetical protein
VPAFFPDNKLLKLPALIRFAGALPRFLQVVSDLHLLPSSFTRFSQDEISLGSVTICWVGSPIVPLTVKPLLIVNYSLFSVFIQGNRIKNW